MKCLFLAIKFTPLQIYQINLVPIKTTRLKKNNFFHSFYFLNFSVSKSGHLSLRSCNAFNKTLATPFTFSQFLSAGIICHGTFITFFKNVLVHVHVIVPFFSRFPIPVIMFPVLYRVLNSLSESF